MIHCPFCGSKNVDPEGWTGLDADGFTKTSGPACDDCGGSAQSVTEWNTRFDEAHDAAPPPVGPLTLDDVGKHLDVFCAEILKRYAAEQAWQDAQLTALTDAIDASPDLDKKSAGMMILTKLNDTVKKANG